MKYRTDDFSRLYGIVTAQLSSLASNVYWRSDAERQWLAYLVVVFQQLFEDWEDDPKLVKYLSALEHWPDANGRTVHRVFRLAGHVYLHVAYDLVRGVAATLDASPPVHRNELHVAASSADTFVRPPPVIVASRPDARLTFLAAAPAFAAALESQAGIDLLGDITLWSKLLGVLTRRKRRLALQAIGQWVLVLRNAALITAETITDMPPSARSGVVQKLREGIERAQTETADRFRITDVQPWTFPILCLAGPLAASILPAWAEVLIAMLGLAFAWAWIRDIARNRQRELLDAIDALGRGMHEALINARREGRDSEPEPSLTR